MILSSYSRIVHRAVAQGVIVLLSACQSGGMAPPHDAASGTKPAPEAISNNACYHAPELVIWPPDPTIKPHQKVLLKAYVLSDWHYVYGHCTPGFGPARGTMWQSNGGRIRPKSGWEAYFEARKVGTYTVSGQDSYKHQTLGAQDTVTVQE
jgi:hypothetical protein